jgi:hypothetical protein
MKCRAGQAGGAIALVGQRKSRSLSCCAYDCDAPLGAFCDISPGLSTARIPEGITDSCQVTRSSPKHAPDKSGESYHALAFAVKPISLARSNITECNVFRNCFGSIFLSRFDEMTTTRCVYRDCGGHYIMAHGWATVLECVMIADGRLEPCYTEPGGFCEFQSCIFRGEEVYFEGVGSLEECTFYSNAKPYRNAHVAHFEEKAGCRLFGPVDVLRFTLSDLGGCPMNGFMFHQRDHRAVWERKSGPWIAIGGLVVVVIAVVHRRCRSVKHS